MNPRDSLSDLLRSWRYQPPAEPEFNAQVWARLQEAERGPAKLSFFPAFARWSLPLAASITVIISAVLGSTAALAYNTAERDDRMASAYARSIDPLQRAPSAPMHHQHRH
ncbi:hypothetical protein DB347_21505 [Opitutaceae bacterium EW11]|nr:hypothetical protein DB347_21505 [Opitutaceae bacterium EW11]